MTRSHHAILATPIGMLAITEEDEAIVRIDKTDQPASAPTTPLLVRAGAQLTEYFAGKRASFDLPLRAKGTAFEQATWAALQRIPFGCTASYSELAAAVGNPKAMRAVGRANGRNPIAIVVPCHRAIGKNGKLVGYALGLPHKKLLIDLEAAAAR